MNSCFFFFVFFSVDALHACLLHVTCPDVVEELRMEKKRKTNAWVSFCPALAEILQSERPRRGDKMCPRFGGGATDSWKWLACVLFWSWSKQQPTAQYESSSCFWDLDCPETTSLLCLVTAQGSYSSSLVDNSKVPLTRRNVTNFSFGLESAACICAQYRPVPPSPRGKCYAKEQHWHIYHQQLLQSNGFIVNEPLVCRDEGILTLRDESSAVEVQFHRICTINQSQNSVYPAK